ncbi:MAG: NAD(P)-binding domain-containing protein, partial [Candidatus Thermoplasmatota archaeon]|nr:NAD(P)-binding domain-containing protein [Candidatus Thermoplasmatota archaeon]
MKVQSIGVIGAGTMGHGIALVAAKAGYTVILNDIKNEYIEKGLQKIEGFLTKSVDKGKMTGEKKDRILSNISGNARLESLKNMDVIIEAIFENITVRKELFQKLEGICKKQTIFASNTSTI